MRTNTFDHLSWMEWGIRFTRLNGRFSVAFPLFADVFMADLSHFFLSISRLNEACKEIYGIGISFNILHVV